MNYINCFDTYRMLGNDCKKISFVEYDNGVEEKYLGVDMSCNRVVINTDSSATEESLGLIKEEDFDLTSTVFGMIDKYIAKDGEIQFLISESEHLEIYHIKDNGSHMIGSIDCLTERNMLSVYIISNEINCNSYNSSVKIL